MEKMKEPIDEAKKELYLKSDEQIIGRFLDGNKEAIGILVERYERQLYFFCLRLVQDHDDALELVQKTFIQVIEKLATLQKHDRFKTWLYRISLHLSHNFLRDKSTYSRVLTALPQRNTASFQDTLLEEEERNLVRGFLNSLTERQRSVIILRIYHNLSYQEIGEILGCREVTARTHFHLGLKRLADKLKKYGDFHEM